MRLCHLNCLMPVPQVTPAGTSRACVKKMPNRDTSAVLKSAVGLLPQLPLHDLRPGWRLEFKALIRDGHIFLLIGKAILRRAPIHPLYDDSGDPTIGRDLQQNLADSVFERDRDSSQR